MGCWMDFLNWFLRMLNTQFLKIWHNDTLCWQNFVVDFPRSVSVSAWHRHPTQNFLLFNHCSLCGAFLFNWPSLIQIPAPQYSPRLSVKIHSFNQNVMPLYNLSVPCHCIYNRHPPTIFRNSRWPYSLHWIGTVSRHIDDQVRRHFSLPLLLLA